MDGLTLVQARIASLQARFEPAAPAPSSALPAIGSFDSILDAAMSRNSATQRARGAYGPAAVPFELKGLINGQLPDSSLREIGVGGHRLSASAASSFRSMRADAARDGIDVGVTDSYRTYAQQVDLADRKGLYSEGGLAAKPGTSDHGWGLSLDVDVNDQGQRWLRANGARYGFVEDVPREPWHWTYRPDPGGAAIT